MQNKIIRSIAHWWDFNKTKLPLYLMYIAAILFTALIDFSVGKKVILSSHIDAINKVSSIEVALYFFLIYFIAIIQTVLMMNHVKKKSIKSAIIVTAIVMLQLFLVILYVNVFLTEHTRLPSYVMTSSTYFSIGTFASATIVSIIAVVLGWFGVDRHHVVEE